MLRYALLLVLMCLPVMAQEQEPIPPAPQNKVWTKSFIAAVAFTVAAQVGGVESTMYATSRPNVYESNSFYTGKPDRAFLYATHIPLTGAAVLISYMFKRAGAGKASYIVLAPVAAIGTYETVHNLREAQK